LLKEIILGIVSTLLLAGSLILVLNVQRVRTNPVTIIVPDDYPTIQEAIKNADTNIA